MRVSRPSFAPRYARAKKRKRRAARISINGEKRRPQKSVVYLARDRCEACNFKRLLSVNERKIVFLETKILEAECVEKIVVSCFSRNMLNSYSGMFS